MTPLTNNVSNLPKTFGQQLYTRIYGAISQKSIQNNQGNRSWLSLSQRTPLDIKSQNIPKRHAITFVATEVDNNYLF